MERRKEIAMRQIIHSVLAAVIILSFAAGFGSFQMDKTAFAAETDKKIKVKAASDFTLELPADWKNCYVQKSSKNKKHGSYVAFYSKKCYKQGKQGWLFTIMRYKDDSYEDMPSYELVGKWNGYYYVALFPTDIQTEGVTKAAKKQYNKLNESSLKAAGSVQPAKKIKKGKGIHRFSDFALKLPDNWKNKYIVKKSRKKKEFSYVAFYAKKCYKKNKTGFLFSIARYKDTSFFELPSYEVVGKWNGFYYVAEFPTDVQFENTSKSATKQYQKLNKSVEKVVRTIRP